MNRDDRNIPCFDEFTMISVARPCPKCNGHDPNCVVCDGTGLDPMEPDE